MTVGLLVQCVLALAEQALVAEKPDEQLGELVEELRVCEVQRRMVQIS